MRLVAQNRPVTGPLNAPTLADLRLEWEGEPPQSVSFRGTPLSIGSSPMALPCVEGELVVRRGEALLRQDIRIEDGLRPSEDDLELLRSWAVLTQKLAPTTWDQLLQLPLLAIESLLHRLKPTDLDALLRSRGRAAISRIAARPRTYIRTEDERVPVGRAVRPARDAERELSRSGAAVMLGRRVVPQQLLTTFTEEEWAIYENRVLITLVMRLRDRVYRRLVEIEDAFRRIDELRACLDRLDRLRQFRRRGRLEKDAAQRIDREDWIGTALAEVEELRAELNGQLATYEAALARPVGLALRRTPRLQAPLRETNILSFDPDYSILPLLWRALERERGHPVDLRVDDPDGAFADLCQVGLARAFDELGYTLTGTPAELWCAGGSGACEARASGPMTQGGQWSAHLRRGRDDGGWLLDVDLGWCPAPMVTNPTLQTHRAPGVAGPALRRREKPETVHRLRLRPALSPHLGACPPSVDEGGRKTVWLHPVDHLPKDGEAALRYFNLHTSPEGRRWPLSLGVHPGDWASADRLGRLIRRFTLWTDLEKRRIPEDCPTCGGPSRVEERGRTCQDENCGARWGLRTCNECESLIPKLLPRIPPQKALDDLLLDHHEMGDKRQLFAELGGRDMLADWPLRPGLDPENDRCNDMLACPHCGAG